MTNKNIDTQDLIVSKMERKTENVDYLGLYCTHVKIDRYRG